MGTQTVFRIKVGLCFRAYNKHYIQISMSDIVSQLNDFLTCNICLEHLKNPRSLPCLHTFCEHCLESHTIHNIKVSVDEKDCIECPLCRCDVELPENGVSDFPSNFMVSNLSDCVQRISGLQVQDESGNYEADAGVYAIEAAAAAQTDHTEMVSNGVNSNHNESSVTGAIDDQILHVRRRLSELEMREAELDREFGTAVQRVADREAKFLRNTKLEHAVKRIEIAENFQECYKSIANKRQVLKASIETLNNAVDTAESYLDGNYGRPTVENMKADLVEALSECTETAQMDTSQVACPSYKPSKDGGVPKLVKQFFGKAASTDDSV